METTLTKNVRIETDQKRKYERVGRGLWTKTEGVLKAGQVCAVM